MTIKLDGNIPVVLEKPLNLATEENKISPEVEKLTETTAKITMDLIQSKQEEIVDAIEINEDSLFEQLDTLSEELKDSLALYKEMTNEEFGGIEGSYADIEYPINPERTKLLNPENVQANAIFSNIELDNPENVAFYNNLLSRLKEKETKIQAQMLCLIDYANVFLAKYFDGKLGSEFNKGYLISLNIIPDLKYQDFIKNIFELYDKDSKKMFSATKTIDWKELYKTK
ncbi:MAG: hypothetical protein PHZ26_02100 [Candidatus Gracilibacteria bacterium]|nr:hypothetical protein [Candidatus Gracilibacteria bacterium]MDD2908527.1 hypothetical protein [Candidatus Gracilibacteria bacterium]